MKKSIVLILFYFLYSPLNAQMTQIFRDDFNDNSNNWILNEYSKISNGKFFASCDDKYIFRMSFQKLNFNDKKNYYFEAKLRQTAGSPKEGYGIVWGASSWKNCLIYNITSEGWYRIYGYRNGKLFSIKKASLNKNINKQKLSYNILAIKKTGN